MLPHTPVNETTITSWDIEIVPPPFVSSSVKCNFWIGKVADIQNGFKIFLCKIFDSRILLTDKNNTQIIKILVK